MSLAVITGANRGIGLEFCRQLKSKGFEVEGVCRKPSPELEKLDIPIHSEVDLTSEASIENLALGFKNRRIDLLVNNAGILKVETIESFNCDTIRNQFETNSLAPIRLTLALRPFMSAGSKVAMITSRMGSISDNTSGSYYGYRMSKAALNIASVSLAQDLKPDNIMVTILHPGYVKTDMTNHAGSLTTEESVNGLIERILELDFEKSGSFWHTNGEALAW